MGKKTNPERRARVAELLEAGHGLSEIARRLGVTIPTVWHYACSLGYEPDPKFNRRYDWAELQRYYDEWRGRPLSMALHHVNGDGRDNRLENLRLPCPNCHSQTENFAGKGVRRLRPVA